MLFRRISALTFDFNPRPPRGGRQTVKIPASGKFEISIHAPREGGDIYPAFMMPLIPISIHAPREGGDAVQKNHT